MSQIAVQNPKIQSAVQKSPTMELLGEGREVCGLLKMQILELHYRSTELGYLCWDPDNCISNKYPGDSDVHQRLRPSS